MSGPDNPCRSCAYCVEKDKHDWHLNIDVCMNPQRNELTESTYRATNHEGPNCAHYDKGRQTQMKEFS